MPRYVVLLASAALLGAIPAVVGAQGPGPFTAAQADRGQATFNQNCSMCHGEDMGGGAGAPALAGAEFAYGWKGKPVSALFDKVSTTMPPGAEGSLSAQQYLDVISAIMRKNGAAPGAAELAPGGAGLKAVVLP